MRIHISLLLTLSVFLMGSSCHREEIDSRRLASEDISFDIKVYRSSKQHIAHYDVESPSDSVTVDITLKEPFIVNFDDNEIKLTKGDSLSLYVDGQVKQFVASKDETGLFVDKYTVTVDNVTFDTDVEARINFIRANSDNRFLEFTIPNTPVLTTPVAPLVDYNPLKDDLYVSWAHSMPISAIDVSQAGYIFSPLKINNQGRDVVIESEKVTTDSSDDCSCRLSPLTITLGDHVSVYWISFQAFNMEDFDISMSLTRSVSLQFSDTEE